MEEEAGYWKTHHELLELLVELEENPLLISKVVRKVLGPAAAAALKDHVRDENGCVSIQKMNDEITEIFTRRREHCDY